MYVLIFEMLMDNSMGWVPWVLFAILFNSVSGFKSDTYGKFSCRIFSYERLVLMFSLTNLDT